MTGGGGGTRESLEDAEKGGGSETGSRRQKDERGKKGCSKTAKRSEIKGSVVLVFGPRPP